MNTLIKKQARNVTLDTNLKLVKNLFEQGLAEHKKLKLLEAKKYYEKILKLQPQNADAFYLLGLIASQNNDPKLVVELMEKVIALKPKNADAHYNLGVALQTLKYTQQALISYKKAIEIKKDYTDAYNNQGVGLRELGKLDEALVSYNNVIKIQPNDADAHNNRGNVLKDLKNFDQALKSFDKAISIKPNYAEYHFNRGNLLKDLKHFDEALKSYNKAIDLKPNYGEVYNSLGATLYELRRFDGALEYFNKSIEINPHDADVYNNRGAVFVDLRQFDQALANYKKAIEINDSHVGAHFNHGNVLRNLKRFDEAIDCYEKVLRLNKDFMFLSGIKLHSQMMLCSWDNLAVECNQLKNKINKELPISPPFPILGLIDDPEVQLKISSIYAKVRYSEASVLGPFIARPASQKIRIGYYSADFFNHAIAHLTVQLYESHNRERFEVYGFSFRPNKEDTVHSRLFAGFDHFIDVSDMSDRDIAKISRDFSIDIAIDLMGYTVDSRSGIFAERCAPIQVNYLGYPGTMGAPYIDYIVADHVLIPKESVSHYSEKIVYMPNSYQVNDSKRTISDRFFSRADAGLPEDGFVFCCFNNNYKITPDIFTVWMRLLGAIEGSVLWIFGDNPTSVSNLRKEALKIGVDPSRIVFASRMENADHLARHRLADLFLDTLPYNAHTTASDALWAGLPLLTLMGKSFAARVASSLLSAMDLPELITHTIDEYEAKALELALHPEKLDEIRQKLNRNRDTSPLFNGRFFAKNLEAAYIAMYERAQNNLPPEHIVVSPQEISTKPEFNHQNTPLPALGFLNLDKPIQVMDIGASVINEVPIYKAILDQGLGHLHAFEGDLRQITKITQTYGSKASVYDTFLFDGTKQTLYLASELSGMTSLLKPRLEALRFFNGFTQFGHIHKAEEIETKRLDDIENLPQIDFIKMDIQGAELTVLQNGLSKLKECVVIQLEVSYINLYENQPSFGDVDVWLRSQGFVPHCFLDVKRWSIAPTIFNNNFRVPGNQVLEADIVYIKDPLKLKLITENQIKKMITIGHYCLRSYDLVMFLLLELFKEKLSPADVEKLYSAELNKNN